MTAGSTGKGETILAGRSKNLMSIGARVVPNWNRCANSFSLVSPLLMNSRLTHLKDDLATIQECTLVRVHRNSIPAFCTM
jgi:hypothetical protein